MRIFAGASSVVMAHFFPTTTTLTLSCWYATCPSSLSAKSNGPSASPTSSLFCIFSPRSLLLPFDYPPVFTQGSIPGPTPLRKRSYIHCVSQNQTNLGEEHGARDHLPTSSTTAISLAPLACSPCCHSFFPFLCVLFAHHFSLFSLPLSPTPRGPTGRAAVISTCKRTLCGVRNKQREPARPRTVYLSNHSVGPL